MNKIRMILSMALLVGGVALGQSYTNSLPTGKLRGFKLGWDATEADMLNFTNYGTTGLDTVRFTLYYSTNATGPWAKWDIGLATNLTYLAKSTNNMTGEVYGPSYNWDLPTNCHTGPLTFYALTVSNLWGESPLSNVIWIAPKPQTQRKVVLVEQAAQPQAQLARQATAPPPIPAALAERRKPRVRTETIKGGGLLLWLSGPRK